MTITVRAWMRYGLVLIAGLASAAPAPAQLCCGDCDGNGAVSVHELVTSVTNDLNGCGAAPRLVANGDGTVSDRVTGLMWAQTRNLDAVANSADVQDADNVYSWSSGGTAADGSIFTHLLPTLNDCVSPDGVASAGGFAGHCDWRLPSIAELSTITLMPFPCATNPCIDSIFGPTHSESGYWSATTNATDARLGWNVIFSEGLVAGAGIKTQPSYVRAVRGKLAPTDK